MPTTNKHILVTGASSGIGYTIAEYFLSKGWKVYGLSRSGRAPDGVEIVVADVTNYAVLKESIDELVKKTGRLDAVVNAAGIGGASSIENHPLDEVYKLMDTNFYGTLHLIKVCLPHMRRQASGTFVSISSIAGLIGVPFHGLYCASKFAVEGLIESLRMELTGTGVVATSVCPGDTKTPIIGNQYRASPSDLPEAYQANYERAEQAMRQSVENGIPPEQVARVVYKAIVVSKPQVRYPVGDWLQRMSPNIKGVLPVGLFERIMKIYYGVK